MQIQNMLRGLWVLLRRRKCGRQEQWTGRQREQRKTAAEGAAEMDREQRRGGVPLSLGHGGRACACDTRVWSETRGELDLELIQSQYGTEASAAG